MRSCWPSTGDRRRALRPRRPGRYGGVGRRGPGRRRPAIAAAVVAGWRKAGRRDKPPKLDEQAKRICSAARRAPGAGASRGADQAGQRLGQQEVREVRRRGSPIAARQSRRTKSSRPTDRLRRRDGVDRLPARRQGSGRRRCSTQITPQHAAGIGRRPAAMRCAPARRRKSGG